MKLHIKGKAISIHAKMDVLDEQDNVVYQVASKAFSIHNKTYIKNSKGEEVAYISRKAISLHNVHEVEMANGVKFELNEELFHLTKDVINIEELGWQLRGDFVEHTYEIVDSNEKTIAITQKKWFSLHNVYYIDVLDEAHQDAIVATIITLAHMLTDKASVEATAASSTAASHGNSGSGK